MEFGKQILDVLNYVAANIPWDAVISAGLLSPLLVGVKKWFSVQSEKVMITLVALTGFLAATAHYLLTTPFQDPSVIAIQGAVLAFMTQPIYFFVVKPLMRWFAKQIEAAAELKLAQGAALPKEGLPQAPAPSIEGIRPVITITPTLPNTTVVGTNVTYPVPPKPQDAKVDDFTH